MAVPARPVDCVPVEDVALDARPNTTFSRTRWRIINTGQLAGINLYTVGVNITPIELDGGTRVSTWPTQGIQVLYPGERVDLVAEQSADPGSPARLFVSLDIE
jgi:hypothetical protein